MKTTKQLHQIPFDYLPEVLIELRRETLEPGALLRSIWKTVFFTSSSVYGVVRREFPSGNT
jgi:hypothetical protein